MIGGADPQVRYLRGVFGRIEEAQGEVLRRIGVSLPLITG